MAKKKATGKASGKATRKRASGEAAKKAGKQAALKTAPTGADVEAFLAGVEDEERRRDCRALVALMKRLTKAPPRMWGPSIVGFGSYRYRYPSGREGEWFLTGFSPRKRDLTLYLMAGFGGSRALLERLGPHRTGKSCLYVKGLEGLDREVLEELVRSSVERVRATGQGC